MTPTPRTDACKFYLALCNNDLPTDAVCPAEKMAELERENAELFDALNNLKCQCVAGGASVNSRKLEDMIQAAIQVVDKYKAARSALGEGGE